MGAFNLEFHKYKALIFCGNVISSEQLKYSPSGRLPTLLLSLLFKINFEYYKWIIILLLNAGC